MRTKVFSGVEMAVRNAIALTRHDRQLMHAKEERMQLHRLPNTRSRLVTSTLDFALGLFDLPPALPQAMRRPGKAERRKQLEVETKPMYQAVGKTNTGQEVSSWMKLANPGIKTGQRFRQSPGKVR